MISKFYQNRNPYSYPNPKPNSKPSPNPKSSPNPKPKPNPKLYNLILSLKLSNFKNVGKIKELREFT